ncbi:adenylate kinase [Methanoculleus chikugoensis]|uniref:adenylate kinase n=1 Tax=Methanoculleus chikugoensis TaxID=118126 RepID=UPI0006CF770F|nr:adenylate kinase [Methanoculleus chikugoensis]
MGKKVVVTGVPGVGKTTVINGAMERLAAEGVEYTAVNFGTFMFEVAKKENLAADRDEMRKLEKDVQKRLQQAAASGIAAMSGGDANVIIDTHSSVKTPAGGFLAGGLPEWVLRELMPDIVVLVETDPDQILMRRLGDASRTRDMEGHRAIAEHQEFNRAVSAAYAMYTGCTIKIVRNENFLLEQGIDDLVSVLR